MRVRFLPLVLFSLWSASPSEVSAQETATYRNPILNIEFTHPKSWKVTTSKKNESKITIPVEGGKESAILEILPVTFESDKDIWQISQKTVVENAKYELVRQWEEEILGVPMLLTRYTFPSRNGSMAASSALLYNNWPRKMFFRLTAGVFEFEKAEFELRQVLNTIKTIDGSAFKPSDPNAPRPAEGTKPVPVEAKTTRVVVIDQSGKKPERNGLALPSVEVPTKAAGRDLLLNLPKGWTATPGAESGMFTLSHPDLKGTVNAHVQSSLDADPANRALFLATDKSLALFDAVDLRRERLPELGPLETNVAWVQRVGKGAQGFVGTFDSVIIKGDFYAVISFQATDRKVFDAARARLENLLLGSDLRQAN